MNYVASSNGMINIRVIGGDVCVGGGRTVVVNFKDTAQTFFLERLGKIRRMDLTGHFGY